MLDLLWLYMNAPANELQVSISKTSDDENLQIDCDVNVHCLFQRVK